MIDLVPHSETPQQHRQDRHGPPGWLRAICSQGLPPSLSSSSPASAPLLSPSRLSSIGNAVTLETFGAFACCALASTRQRPRLRRKEESRALTWPMRCDLHASRSAANIFRFSSASCVKIEAAFALGEHSRKVGNIPDIHFRPCLLVCLNLSLSRKMWRSIWLIHVVSALEIMCCIDNTIGQASWHGLLSKRLSLFFFLSSEVAVISAGISAVRSLSNTNSNLSSPATHRES